MKTTKELLQAWTASRTFRSKTFRSGTGEPLCETTMLYGGTMQTPNIICTCPRYVFQGRWCGHCDDAWNELSNFTKNDIIHHDEIVAKPWYRNRN